MNKDIIMLKKLLNPIEDKSYTTYEEKIQLITDHLKDLRLMGYKPGYVEKQGFKKLTEVRCNNSGEKDGFGMGKKELLELIDKIVREGALKKTIYMCLTSTNVDFSYVAFYTY